MIDPFREPTLSPGRLSELTEPTPDLQRNYRTRGMMDAIGTATDTGRWRYSLNDLVAVWVSDRLCERGYMDRRRSLNTGAAIAERVISAHLAAKRHGACGFPRFVASLTGGTIATKSFDRLEQLDGTGFVRAEIIDVYELGKIVPDSIGVLLSDASRALDKAIGCPVEIDETGDDG